MISKEKKALLHVAKAELGLEDDVYREILRQESGVESARDLSEEGFERVLKRFQKLGFRVRRGGRRPARPREQKDGGALVGQQQLSLIRHLYEDLGWVDLRRQIGFNRRVCGRPWPQTRAEANKVIEGLKAMLARQAAKG